MEVTADATCPQDDVKDKCLWPTLGLGTLAQVYVDVAALDPDTLEVYHAFAAYSARRGLAEAQGVALHPVTPGLSRSPSIHEDHPPVLLEAYPEEARLLTRTFNYAKAVALHGLAPRRARVLDVGCNRGTDVCKFSGNPMGMPAFVIFQDIVADVMTECERRWRREKYPYPAGFIVADMARPQARRIVQLYSSDPDRQKNQPRVCVPAARVELGLGSLDVVSCHNVLQYAFRTPAMARAVLQDFRHKLADGGRILMTVPDGQALAQRFAQAAQGLNGPDGPDGPAQFTVGDVQQYSLPPSQAQRPVTCLPYTYRIVATLPDGTVAPLFESTEYFIFAHDLIALAHDVGLTCVWHTSYAEIVRAAASVSPGLPRATTLAQRMKINLAECSSSATLADLELSHFYCFMARTDRHVRTFASFLPTSFAAVGRC